MRNKEIKELYETLEKIKKLEYENKEEKLKELYDLKVRFNKVLIDMKEENSYKDILKSINQTSPIGAEKYIEKLINKALVIKKNEAPTHNNL